MTKDEFNRTAGMMRVFKDCITPQTYDTWYDSLRRYEYRDIDQAVRMYIKDPEKGGFNPKPANIIAMLPKSPNTGKYVRRYEMIDGVEKRVIACKQCLDTGLVMSVDSEGRTVGHPCTCTAAHDKYSWGWLDRSEQEAFIAKNGHHGEVVGEVWA